MSSTLRIVLSALFGTLLGAVTFYFLGNPNMSGAVHWTVSIVVALAAAGMLLALWPKEVGGVGNDTKVPFESGH